ncbi:hypothetical protein [Kitasatospora sp. NPDC088134]|uniref:hypothetical protein n=1 Tax=Kitasatospora sp. NPDC088134 TaxID=3364071 RepID=UPI0038205AC2
MTTSSDRPDAPATSLAPGHPALSLEAVEALVEAAVESVVDEPSADTVLGLVEALEEAGALWAGALVLLGPAAGRPSAVGEADTVARLRKAAETPDKVTALTYRLWAEFRALGSAAAREVWEAAPAEIRRASAAQMLVVHADRIGGEAGTLTPRATMRLLREVVPVTW